MFHIILYCPEIPPNTGNAVRLAANTGCTLHLVKPLGFATDDRSLRRAGLDYAELTTVRIHEDWTSCLSTLGPCRMFALTTKGSVRYDMPDYRPGDALVFGPETRGLPSEILDALPPRQRLRLPMLPGNRSINLSNAVAVTVYEAWRQNRFAAGT